MDKLIILLQGYPELKNLSDRLTVARFGYLVKASGATGAQLPEYLGWKEESSTAGVFQTNVNSPFGDWNEFLC